MFDFRLNQPLAPSSNADGNDVLAMKGALGSLGEYELPSYGMTPYPDTPMFEGMKRFQKKNGLTVDGIARPGGPTEATVKARLARIRLARIRLDGDKLASGASASSGGTARPPHDPRAEVGAIAERIDRHPGRWDRPTVGDPANRDRRTADKNPLSLSTGVGRNQPNGGRDVVSIKNALSWLGHYPADKARRADPTPDDDLLWGLQDFQRAFGLARDGFSLPGGETERKLR